MRTLLLATAATLLVTGASHLSAAEADKAPARALILTGVNNHDWKATTPHLKSVLEKGGFQVDVSDRPRCADPLGAREPGEISASSS